MNINAINMKSSIFYTMHEIETSADNPQREKNM